MPSFLKPTILSAYKSLYNPRVPAGVIPWQCLLGTGKGSKKTKLARLSEVVTNLWGATTTPP